MLSSPPPPHCLSALVFERSSSSTSSQLSTANLVKLCKPTFGGESSEDSANISKLAFDRNWRSMTSSSTSDSIAAQQLAVTTSPMLAADLACSSSISTFEGDTCSSSSTSSSSSSSSSPTSCSASNRSNASHTRTSTFNSTQLPPSAVPPLASSSSSISTSPLSSLSSSDNSTSHPHPHPHQQQSNPLQSTICSSNASMGMVDTTESSPMLHNCVANEDEDESGGTTTTTTGTTGSGGKSSPNQLAPTPPHTCFACRQPILDRYLACISPECYWHEQCLQCAVCRILLTRSCYVKERKLYCKHDYNKLYAVKCSNCLEAIGPNELVMRVHNYVYHVACFTCTRCGRQLRKGDQYTMRPGGRLICRHDLESEGQQGAMALLHGAPLAGNYPHSPATPVASGTRPSMSPGIELAMLGTSPSAAAPPQLDERCNGGKGSLAAIISPDLAYSASPRAPHNCDPSQPPLGPSSGASGPLKNEPYSPQHQHQQAGPVTQVPPPPPMKQDGRRGPKRPRTILTTAQRRAFKTSFEISQKPCRKVRETLAKETGLSVRIVQVWFQNQRAKLKKIQRKQQQQQMAHGGPGSGQGGGGLLGIGNGSESGGGIGSHSSDKSKDDSSDEEDDDGSTVAAFSLPSMHRYMMHSPDDASYYSREDDSHGGYLSVVKGSNPDTLTALDGDSETSLCELDEASMAPDSATAVAAQPPPRSSDGADLELTCLDGGELGSGMFHSPTLPPFGLHPHHHHAHLHHHQPAASQHNNMVHINLGALIPAPGATALLSVSPQVSTTTAPLPSSEGGNALMTPIDKLYSMQNSYFSNPSECEC